MDFFTGSLVAVGGIAVIVAIALVGASKSGEGATVRDRIMSSPFLSPLLIIHYFLPYALVVLVIFMDIMSQLPQGIWSFLIAFAAIFVNSVFNDPTLLPNDLCEIPGFKSWSSNMIPQSLLFVTIIVTYLAAFVTGSQQNVSTNVANTSSLISLTTSLNISPSTSARLGATWGLALSVILFQTIGLLTTPGCLTNMKAFGRASVFFAILIGSALGSGAGYGFSQLSMTQPSYAITSGATVSNLPFVPGGLLPNQSSNSNPIPPQSKGPGFVRERFQLGSGLGEIPMPPSQGGDVPIDIAKSSGAVTPGESSDQFVCEAYKNGQLVTSTLVG